MSRSANSLKNAVLGIGGRLFTYVLHFVSRTVFIYILGIEYLGIQGLFANILGLLNLAELGFSIAVAQTLYKPLAENDTDKIYAIMNFLKKTYAIIGTVILVIGLSLIPVLPMVVENTTDLVDLNLVYVLYLAETAASYLFFAYKSTLLIADQKRYVIHMVNMVTSVVGVVLQILALIIVGKLVGPTEAYILYLVINCIMQLVLYGVVYRKTDERYPYLKEKKKVALARTEIKELLKKVFGMSIYKVDFTIVKSTDSIIISKFLGIAATGNYSNYYFIISNVFDLVRMIFASTTASVGNLLEKDTKEKNEFVFRCLGRLSYWIFGVCSVCMFVLIEPFLKLWAGEIYSLGRFTAYIFAFEFLMEGFQVVSVTYKDACGLFWYGKFRPLATAILNITFSIYLVKYFGIAGVIMGTILSRVLTTWWFEPMLVYRKTFKMPVWNYFVRYIFAVFLVLVDVAVIEYIGTFCPSNEIAAFIIKILLCVTVSNITFYIAYRKTEEFEYIKQIALNLMGGIIKKVRKNAL